MNLTLQERNFLIEILMQLRIQPTNPKALEIVTLVQTVLQKLQERED